MARGKIYTNRKKTLRVGEEKKKQASKSKKDKKLAQKKREKKPIATDVFDYRTGVVYSIRPEDTDVHALEAKVTSFLKEKGAIDDPKEFLTTAVYLGEPHIQTPPTTEIDTPPSIAPPALKSKTPKMTSSSSEVPVTFWHEVKDVKSNNTYYWHPETNRTSWTLPENAVITSEASERSDKITDPENEEAPDLVKAYNHIAKTVYGVNEGEVKGNGMTTSQQQSSETDSESKLMKDKKQPNTEGIPLAEALTPDLNSKSSKTRSKTTAVSKAESPMLKIQVSNMSDEIFRKLEYLHVSRERVSELQKLQIQLDTRMEDWKEEQLSSKFFLAKLKSASDQINSFVQQEVPTGWTCVWDRASCRYYFSNVSTGEVSWEFPVINPDSVSSPNDATVEEDSEVEQQLNQPNTTNGPIAAPPPAPPQASMSVSPPPPPPPAAVTGSSSEVTHTAANIKTEPSLDYNGETSASQPVIASVKEEEITEVDMEVEGGSTPPELIKPENAEVDMTKADTPPMHLYDDVGPLTQQQQQPLPMQSSNQEKVEDQSKADESDKSKEETLQPSVVNSIDRKSVEEGEMMNSEGEEKVTSHRDDDDDDHYRYHKKSKRSRYHSDSDNNSYDGHRKSSSKKSRKRHSSDDSDYSDGHRSSRRRSRSSGDKNYDRSDSEDRYYRKSRSSKYSRDDSDNDQYSSSRRSSHKQQRSRSRSRDHGSRDPRKDKKKKKDKKKHKHRDSSSGDEYYSSSRKSKTSKSRDRSYDFGGTMKNSSNRESQSKEQNPPTDKKAFVPAKFKPKPKGRDDGDDSRLSATQLEMMQNIASVTGSYMMAATTYPHMVDPQYAAYYTTAPGYDASTVPVVPVTATTVIQEQVATPSSTVPVPPANNVPTTSTSQSDIMNSTGQQQQMAIVSNDADKSCPPAPSDSTDQGETPTQPNDEGTATITESKPEPPPQQQEDKSPPIKECSMELDDEGEGQEGDKSSSSTGVDCSEPPAEQPPTTSDTPPATTVPDTAPTATSDQPTDKEEVTPVSAAASSSTAVPPVATPTTTTADTPTSGIPGDTTPPIQDLGTLPQSYSLTAAASSVATTYANPPTSYPSYTDPTQQAAYAAVYSQQYYGSPYQYYTDPNQYAAAMNYYAAYQAAYNSTYNAYYQQQASSQNPAAPGSNNGGNGQK